MDTSELIATIIARGDSITRQDINDVLVSVGAPGELRDDKLAAITELLKGSHDTANGSILDTLDGYGAF